MASRRAVSSAARAWPLTYATTGIPHLRARGLSSAPRAPLPSVAALPLSAVSRGGVPTLSSMGNSCIIQRPACSGLRQFSSGGGAKLPSWMDIDKEKPAKLFRELDYHGRNIVILCNQLLHEKGEEIGSSLSCKMQDVEKTLLSKIEAGPDEAKFKLDRFMTDAFNVTWKVATLGGAVYVFMVSKELIGRVVEALGQMKKHSPEIVAHFAVACRDGGFKPNIWPFVKFDFVIPDRWWIDPEKQAKRDMEAQKKLAKKKKKNGGGKK